MKAIDILTLAQGICETLDKNDIKAGDVRYIQMYRDWLRLKNEGHKYDWIMYWLAKEYDTNHAVVPEALSADIANVNRGGVPVDIRFEFVW